MELKQKIGLGLYNLRIQEGYNREEFSSFAEISLNSYSSIENGKSLIKLTNLENLLSSLSLSMSYFFESIDI